MLGAAFSGDLIYLIRTVVADAHQRLVYKIYNDGACCYALGVNQVYLRGSLLKKHRRHIVAYNYTISVPIENT
jgi:hypothetical protein